jgi:hypothetical protein
MSVVEAYDPNATYNIGDQCFVDYGFNEDGTPAILQYTATRPHEAGEVGVDNYPPVIPELFPDEYRYYRDWDSEMWWELEWPIWSEEEPWGQAELCTYEGRYYSLTWRAKKKWNKVTEEYEERLLIDGYPNELEDEEGVRVWQTTSPSSIAHSRVCSFDLAPFNLERHYDNPATFEVETSPYGDPSDPQNGSLPVWGVGRSIGAFSGASLMMYQDYPPDIREVQIPVYDDEWGGVDSYETSNETVIAGGTTEATLCGCAFQRGEQGIEWGGDVNALEPDLPVWHEDYGVVYYIPPEGLKEPVGFAGGDTESPPYPNPLYPNPSNPEEPEFLTHPASASQADWHRTAYVFFHHNHPLFFHRQIGLQVTVTVKRRHWKGVYTLTTLPPPPPPTLVLTDYAQASIEKTWKANTTFKPKSDCFASYAGNDQQPTNGNAIGKFRLQGGAMVDSYLGATGVRPDLTPGNSIFGQGEGILFLVLEAND